MYREQHNFREFIFGHSVCKMYLHSLHIQRRFGGLIQLIGHNNNMRWYIVLLYVCTMVILFLHGLLQKIQNCHITAGEWLVYLPDVVLRRSWCHNIDNTFIPRVYPPPILTLYLGVASNQGPLYTFNQSRARMFKGIRALIQNSKGNCLLYFTISCGYPSLHLSEVTFCYSSF